MSLTQGDPLPNIDTTKTVETTGPDWYNTYLEGLAKPGTDLLKKTGSELIEPMSDLQQGVLDTAETELDEYTDTMTDAVTTAENAAKGITPELIQSFMNPYTGAVTDEMARLQQQNMQRNFLPSLKAAFGNTGASGSSRMMSALGQMGADAQANLLGQQSKAMGEQVGLYRNAAETQRGIAVSELDTKLKELERLYNLGSEEQKLAQAEIMAPLTVAKSAADVYSNLKVPSTVSEEASAPIPGAYSSSPLSQVAGLGALFASGQGGTSAASGVLDALFGKGYSESGKGVLEWLKGLGGPTGGGVTEGGSNEGGYAGDPSNYGNDTIDYTDDTRTQEEIDLSDSLGDFGG